ncbi:unnamed protein product [Peronospora belbahrii]|uniref:Uncharacterized protein n=1 Tax=Peronospora belbahrii TaxID=622444 RepID=A0ABN8D603_9STRA|nr:unnamed protein product [Peronospora belbahrii]
MFFDLNGGPVEMDKGALINALFDLNMIHSINFWIGQVAMKEPAAMHALLGLDFLSRVNYEQLRVVSGQDRFLTAN